jgi:3-isopropylmalate dehydrogenase
MTTYKLLMLPGDGIGPEVAREVAKITSFLDRQGIVSFATETELVGGAAIDAHGIPVTDSVVEAARGADAVLFGAVGGPKWDGVAYVNRVRPSVSRPSPTRRR